MRKYFKNLITLSSVISLITIPIFVTIPLILEPNQLNIESTSNANLNNSSNNTNTQSTTSNNYFSQTLTPNYFSFDSSLTGKSNAEYLFSSTNNSLDQNAILKFKEPNNGETVSHTLELDLNIWKPIGMDDSVFLRSVSFGLSGIIKSNNNESINRILEWNINKNDDFKNAEILNLDWDNLNIPTGNSTRKLIFNFSKKSSSNNFQNETNGYCYIGYDIEHYKDDNNNVNKLWITPKIFYSKPYNTNINNFNFLIDKYHPITLIFKSDFLVNNENRNTSVDSYVSDQQRFNIYEKQNFDPENNKPLDNPKTEPYILLSTYASKSDVRLGVNQSGGYKIPPLKIDTSNLYFDDDLTNHRNTTYRVNIGGIKVSTGLLKIKDKENVATIEFYKKDNKSNKFTELNISFDIRDNEFLDENSFKFVDIPLFSQNDVSEYVTERVPASVKLQLKIEPQKDPKTNKRIPFKYLITEFKFIGTKFLDSENKQASIDTILKIHASNNVIVKTKPLDFSFNRLNYELLKIQKNLFSFQSSYSSNVFDDSYILDQNNLPLRTNLDIVKDELNYRFNSLLNHNIDFQNAGINNATLNEPFVKHQYTSNNRQYRTKGNLTFRFGLVNENKYTDNLEAILRVQINKSQNQHEIISVDFNQKLLNEKAKSFNNINQLVAFLNKLDLESKRQYLNIINLDDDYNANFLINELNFDVYGGYNKIIATFNLTSNYYVIDNNHHLINSNCLIISDNIEIQTFNQEQVSVSLNEDQIRSKAQLAIDYNDFKTQNINNIKQFVQISNQDAINYLDFVDEPNFTNKISIKVVLVDGYLFDNNSSQKIISCANVNWKGQNNVAVPIKIDLNKPAFAQSLINYYSADDFIKQNQNPNLNDWANAIEFYAGSYPEGSTSKPEPTLTTIDDLASIRFETVSNSLRKIKVIFQAKEWRYFDFEGSTPKDDTIEFTVGNILWKDENPNQLTGLTFDVDWPYLCNLLVEHYSTNNKNSFKSFIDKYKNNFIVFKKNEVSIIKINPYDYLGFNAPNITYDKNGIYITVELNDGYYWNINNDLQKDQFNSTYKVFISTGQIKTYYEEMSKPNNQNFVNEISLNTTKLANDAIKYDNINQFIRNISDDYAISEYLVFSNYQDIAKVKDYELVKNDDTSLNIIIHLNPLYSFIDEAVNVKTKTFRVNNLLFKNQTQNLIAVSFSVDSKKLATIARNYYNVDELVAAYENKTSYQDFADFISISDDKKEAINYIKLINGINANSVQLEIQLNNGYYFKNNSPLISTAKVQINNLLFKNDPPPEQVLNGVNITLKGNQLLEFAKTFNNFDEFKIALINDSKYIDFLTISTNKPTDESVIKFIDINWTQNHKAQLKIVLNDGYYFNSKGYYDLTDNIIIGNLYFNNEPNSTLTNIDIGFNTKSFYKLMNNHHITNWLDFINVISPRVMNFYDQSNAMLWTNTDDENVYEVIQIIPSNDNGIIVRVGLKNGYYFSDDDYSNTQIDLNYSQQTLVDYYNRGKEEYDHDIFTRNLIIILSTTIPFIAIAIFVIIWVLKTKRKNIKEINN